MNRKTRNQEKKRGGPAPIWHYVIMVYLIFWFMVLILCGSAAMIFLFLHKKNRTFNSAEEFGVTT